MQQPASVDSPLKLQHVVHLDRISTTFFIYICVAWGDWGGGNIINNINAYDTPYCFIIIIVI